ncbi:MAG: hypothetical protein NC253_02900 [Ruminococcus sp.]|nr:hypothetical protein [Ruminococcus sp.]MCM1380343.1 hypothetical protein [Muribaculaceae bacterium]MCM1478347.1 hypothetical protein [Muribaculaceae bacterium]
MDNYVLRPGEVLNGGYTVYIGGFTLRIIGGYEAAWENVYTQNNFTDYKGDEHKKLAGKRFSLKLTTGAVIPEDKDALIRELKQDYFLVSCPDFEGYCYCDSIPAVLEQANFNGTRYKLTFTLIARELINPNGGGL